MKTWFLYLTQKDDFPEDKLHPAGLRSSRLGQQQQVEKKSSLFFPQPSYQFADPCPESMKEVNIADLSTVDINWKMLTLARPTSKTDEEIFSKWEYIWDAKQSRLIYRVR